ncbi:MAG: SpoIIE family protein phosphatase, partial [Actinobacteria bacterium]|nr:SpoIIE family protein phosphatase [Actinomycetota bacterium]
VRHSRRRNLDLEAVHLDASAAVRDPFGDEPFVTADLAELDIEAGRMRWINAGHPPPLLFRRGQAFTELTCAPSARSERPQSAGAWAKSPDADAAGTPHTPRDDRPEERPAEDDSGSRLSLDPIPEYKVFVG